MKKIKKSLAIIFCLTMFVSLFAGLVMFPADSSYAADTALDNCDSSSNWSSDSTLSVNTTDKKEGTGCLQSDGSNVVQFYKSFGSSVNSFVNTANGCLQFWYYVSDVTMLVDIGQVEISSSGTCDVNEYHWTFDKIRPNLKNGWNLVNLRISEAISTGGTCDLANIRWFRIYNDVTGSISSKLDIVRFVTATSLDRCDSTTSWLSDNGIVSLDTANKKEGVGSLQMAGSNVTQFMNTFSSSVDTGVNESTGYLQLWYYISDATKLSAIGQIEITSSGTYDNNEYAWMMPTNLVNGWNLLTLKISDATKIGSPNLAAINWFRIYDDVSASVTAKIDDIYFLASPISSSPTSTPRVVTTQFASNDVVVADYNVTDAPYNADISGVNDATTAIQNAINDCYNSGGGTVWLPAGTYKVTSTISVKPFVTIRGDWRNPDSGSGSYGTVISAQVASSASNYPGLFRIGGSAGCMGLTVFYPNQSASNPVAYPYTFEIPGRAWLNDTNYMMSSVINCTLLNSYKGICASLTPSDHGGDVAIGQVHEMANIVNVKGTALYRGLEFQNAAEVDNFEDVKFDNAYWANAGSTYNAPSITTLNTYTRANGIGFTFGDVEQEQFYGLTCSQYNIGFNMVTGQRTIGSGGFYGCSATNCNVGFKNNAGSYGWGFTRCTLSGSNYSIYNINQPPIKLTDCTLSGSIYSNSNVTISNLGTSPSSYTKKSSLPKPSNNNFYNVLLSPYNADNTGTNDATMAIQNALTAAGNAGGGTVYLPAGKYMITTHLTVPAGVELRGSSPIPSRDQTGLSIGTIICAYEGQGTSTPDTATAAITLNGTNAGIKGLRVWYPNNNPINSIYAFPYTIRGNGSGVYAIDVTLINSYNGIDFKTNCNNHYVRRVQGLAFSTGILVGGSEGWIEGCLTNGTYIARTGFTDWVTEGYLFSHIFSYTEANTTWIKCDGAVNEHLLNEFEFGMHILASFTNSTATIINAGGDNGTRGNNIGIEVVSGTVIVVNLLKSGGTDYTGSPSIYTLIRLA